MTTLTAQEIAEVAREVTGRSWRVTNVFHGEDIILDVVFDRDAALPPLWEPSFTGPALQRDQALAVVEWLSKKTQNRNPRAHSEILDAVAEGRIDLLQRMVLELKRGR